MVSVALLMASTALSRQPYLLSNFDLVTESFTLMQAWKGSVLDPFVQAMHSCSGFFRKTLYARSQFLGIDLKPYWSNPHHHPKSCSRAVCPHQKTRFVLYTSQTLLRSCPSRHIPDSSSSNGSSCMILGRENITGAPGHIGTQFNQGFYQNSSLDGHVQASRYAGHLLMVAHPCILPAMP